jgi:hypothetical protein
VSDIGAKIELQGEQVFRDALTQINSSLKVTASELKLVSARYTDNATSIEALNSKHSVLNKSYDEQNKKVEKLREALRNATLKFGEADTKTQKWQIALNNAETELIKLDKELSKNQKEIDNFNSKTDEATKTTGTLGDKLNGVISNLGVELPKGAQNAIGALNKVSGSTLALVGASVSLVAGFAKSTIQTAKLADEILTLSNVTGLSTDTIQELNYASEFLDVSSETVTGSMRKMIKSMDDARGGGKEASAAFKELHVSITNNGQLRDSEEVFYNVIDALGKMTNETERDALAMKIFGKSAQELNPLIEAGSEALKKYAAQAQALGYVLGPDTLKRFGELDDSLQKFSYQSMALKGVLAQALLPVMTAMFKVLNEIDPKILATVAIIGSMAVVAVTVVKSIGSVIGIFSAMNPATLKTTAIIVGVTAALIALAAIIAVIMGQGDQLNRTMSNIGNSVGQMTNSVNGAGQRIGYNAMGTNNWRGGRTWVGEQGPELIDLPTGSKVYSNRTSRQMLNSTNAESGTVNNYYLQVNAEDINDVVKMKNTFTSLKQTSRAGVVRMA